MKKPVLLYVVNVDWFFASHRLSIARAALSNGYEVHVAATLSEPQSALEGQGFVLHSLHVDRKDTGLVGAGRLFWRILSLYRQIRPDIVHLVTVKPVLFGGIAARLTSVHGVVCAISGLGYLFIADGMRARWRRRIVGLLYNLALSTKNVVVIFQNSDDRSTIEGYASLNTDQIALIRGSGVDLKAVRPTALPDGMPIVMMPARLLVDKGVREFVEAARQLRPQCDARFVLVGDVDPGNPASVQPSEVERWVREGVIEWWGHRIDMPTVLAQSHIVVLPSYREGMPKVLLEAAACGRAVVTSDVPGCRDAIKPNETGLLVPVRNSQALAMSILELIRNVQRREELGSAGRRLAEECFDVRSVVQQHMTIYESLLPKQL